MSIVLHLGCTSPRTTICRFAALLAASLSFGCATESAATPRLPRFSTDGFAVPGAPAEAEWAEWGAHAASTTVAPSASQDEWGGHRGSGRADPGHVTLLVGVREMEKDTWDPLEDQTVGAIEFDKCDPATGHGYEIGVAYSKDDDHVDLGGVDVDVDAKTIELYGGYRYTFRAADDGYHPYVGLGLAVINAELEASALGASDSEDDTSPGAYVRMGVTYDIGERMRVGLDYRHLFGTDIDIEGVDGNANFDQLALTLGWAF